MCQVNQVRPFPSTSEKKTHLTTPTDFGISSCKAFTCKAFD
jgi:hypothetical protein